MVCGYYKMFKYRKVETHPEKSADNEVRVSNAKSVRAYLTYVHGLFEEKKLDTIILRGTGYVIHKCLAVADLVRRRIKDLAQIVEFGTLEMSDMYEPLEEGLDKVTLKRKIPFITIKLSQKPLDKAHPGYSDPLPASEVTPFTPYAGPMGGDREGEEHGRGRYGGRGFGGRGRRGGFGFRGGRGGRRGGFRGRYGQGEGGRYRGGFEGQEPREGGEEGPRDFGEFRPPRRFGPRRGGPRGGRRGGMRGAPRGGYRTRPGVYVSGQQQPSA